jgi:hypothetical protein
VGQNDAYLAFRLKNAKREELALIGSQFWLLITTIYAVGISVFVSHLD